MVAARNLVGALAIAGLLLGAQAVSAQVRAGFGGVRGGGMGGFSGGAGARMSAPRSFSRPMPSAARAPSAPRTQPAARAPLGRGPNGQLGNRVTSRPLGNGVTRSQLGGQSFFDSRGRTFVDGSGLTVKGSFTDDNFRLAFRLGTPTGLICDPGHDFGRHGFCKPDFCSTPSFPFLPWGGWYSYYSEPAYPIDGYYAPLDPQLIGYTPRPTPTEEPPPPPTPREIGDAALYSGYPERAVTEYRAHLATNPDDAEVIRLLGLALIDARDLKEGVAVVGMAYRKDPSLCERVIPEIAFGDRVDLRGNVNRVSTYAGKVNSASAWLAMAVLVQAEGRRDVALRMVERARAAGLEKTLADRMVTALAK